MKTERIVLLFILSFFTSLRLHAQLRRTPSNLSKPQPKSGVVGDTTLKYRVLLTDKKMNDSSSARPWSDNFLKPVAQMDSNKRKVYKVIKSVKQ